MRTKLMKKIGVSVAALALGAMMVVPVFADGSAVYAKFCKDGTTTVSMTQLAVDGPATVSIEDGEAEVTIPLDGFQTTKMGITATGYLDTLTVNGTTYTATYGTDTDNDGYKNGTITFTIPEAKYSVDSSVYSDVSVEADLEIINGTFSAPMTSDADLYFSSTQPVYAN